MSLSNLSAAFNQSTRVPQKSHEGQKKREGFIQNERAVVTPSEENEGRPQTIPEVLFPEAKNRRIDRMPYRFPISETENTPEFPNIPDGIALPEKEVIQDPDMKDKMLAELQKDVNFVYDEETKTITISGGEISQHTTDALRAYMDLSDGEFDGASIVIGQDVTFKNSIKKDITGKYSITGPTFGDIKCKDINIQSQNITNADHMFAGTQAYVISVADQPNLESADSMFARSGAKTIFIGEFPDSVLNADDSHIFDNCDAPVLRGHDIVYGGSPKELYGHDRTNATTIVYGQPAEDMAEDRTTDRVQQAEDELGVTVGQMSTSNEKGLGE